MARREPSKLEKAIAKKLTTTGDLPEDSAMALAKSIIPTVRKAVQKEVEEASAKQTEAVKQEATKQPHLPKVSPDGVVPVQGAIGAELLQRVQGLTSGPSYIAGAVKQEQGIIAIRSLSSTELKVKFYPDFAYWGLSMETLTKEYGGVMYKKRDYCERLVFSVRNFSKLEEELLSQAATKKRVKQLDKRLLVAQTESILKPLGMLHEYESTQED